MNIKNIIREEIDDFDWIKDISNKKHSYGVVLLEKDYQLIYIEANDIQELWSIYYSKYGKGLDPMLYSVDGRILPDFRGLEPKVDIARKIHESNDFDWIQETNPIKIEPMTVYYTLENFHRHRDEDVWSFLKYVETYSPDVKLIDGSQPTILLNSKGVKTIFINENMFMSLSYTEFDMKNPYYINYKKVDITGFRRNDSV